MKTIAVLVTVLLLVLPVGSASAANPSAGRVVLTADQVHTAVDIETAMQAATANGTRPGVVVLDGSQGAFEYDPAYGDDFDINIFYSDLTLRGINNASLNGGGINLDGMPLQNITIAYLEMHCPAECITSPDGMHRNITIRNNKLVAGGMGIAVALTDGWLIQDNTIIAESYAVHVLHAAEVDVLGNELSGYISLSIERSNGCRVVANKVYANWQGILLTSPSRANKVNANIISGVQAAGIALEPGTQRNSIHGNQVQCAVWAEGCLTVDASEAAAVENNISGNKP